jgi:hypothetical protein
MMLDTSIERLRLLTEQLEMIRRLLDNDSPVDVKVAIILLDNVADSLMYRYCLQEFESDSAISIVIKPRFTLKKRDEALRDFKAKANLLNSIAVLTREDSMILKIGHSYRNAAYHRDSHNPRVTNKLGRLLFVSVCNLFTSYYKNGVSVGGKEEKWLLRYGVRSNLINLEAVARIIARNC